MAAGVRNGMPLSTARILATEDGTEPACLELNAENDFVSLCRLAVWAIKFSPLVSIDEELFQAFRDKKLPSASALHNGLIIDITGTEKLHGGWPSLATRLSHAFRRRNIGASIAIAPTVGAAWALSRFGGRNPVILDRSVKIEDALSPLPLAALRLQYDVVSNLEQLGIEQISGLLKLPRRTLTGRFGPMLLTRLEQALGTREEVLRFARVKELFEVEKRFEIPLLRHAILQNALLELFEELLAQLEESNRKASCFTIEVSSLDHNRDITTTTRDVAFYHASTKKSHIISVIGPVVEKIRAEEGVTKVKITARFVSDMTGEQRLLVKDPALISQQDAIAAGGELLNHLIVRLGKDQIQQVSFEASWIPEKSFSYKPVQSEKTKIAPELICSGRPSYFLNQPQAANVVALLPDAPPAQITWEGRRLKIIHGSGPERICPEWWLSGLPQQSAAEARDYFKVQDETGRWLWVFRDRETSSWFVHGMWV